MVSRSHITIIWRDEAREPLKTFVEMYDISDGFVALTLTGDLRRPGIENKALYFPADTIESVQVEEGEFPEPAGYREENSFREKPENSRWFSGMGSFS